MENLKTKRYLTRKEAAELLQVTPQTISNYIKDGLIVETGRDVANNAIKILTSSVVKLLDDGYDILEQTRAIENYRKSLKLQRNALVEEKENLETTLELVKAKDYYLKNLKKITETLCAFLIKENGLSLRDKYIVEDLLLDKNEEHMIQRYGIKKERVRQIFIRAIRIISRKRHIPYNELEDRNKKLELELRTKQDTILVLEKKIEKFEEQLNLKKDICSQNTSSNDPNVLRIPMSLIGLSGISVRLYNILRLLDISNLYELTMLSRQRFARMRNLGRKSLCEADSLLEKHGLKYNIESLIEVCSNSTEKDFIEVPLCLLFDKKEKITNYL